jgi:RNA polymerase sigma-70 factor (ECF subfamily)
MEKLDIIIKGCIKNNRKYQEKLFEMYYGKMLTIAMSYIKDDDSAKELVEESFINIFNNLSSYNDGINFYGWLRRIVVNTAIDKIIKEKPSFILSDISSNIATQADEFNSEITSEYIIKTLRSLPDCCRIVFNMHALEGMSHQEISEKLNIVVETSKSHYHRANEILNNKLNELQV